MHFDETHQHQVKKRKVQVRWSKVHQMIVQPILMEVQVHLIHLSAILSLKWLIAISTAIDQVITFIYLLNDSD